MNVVSVLFATLMVAIAMEKCLNNYILVKIRDASGTPSGVSDENNLEALFSDQKRSEDTPTARVEKKYVYGKYVYFGDYPIPIDLSQHEKDKCKNPELASSGNFLVTKTMTDIGPRFEAVPQSDVHRMMSNSNSRYTGECDDVTTIPEFQGCGLAKYLTATCFQDDSVLGMNRIGVDINNHGYWKAKKRNKQRKNASKYCQTITFLRCMPHHGAPLEVCVSYLRAASISEFNLAFTTPELEFISGKAKPFNVFKLGQNLEDDFKSDAKKFLEKYGLAWFFCKCKENKEKKCLKMINRK